MAAILIVDDNHLNIATLQTGLAQENYEIYTARNGVEALELAQSIKPDLILLDVIMPKMNGFEVCLQLKQSAATRDIPVIFVTALEEEVDKLHGFEVGGEDYITKPFAIEEVVARVKVHLTIREQKQLLEKHRQEDIDYFTRINEIKNDLMHQLKHDVRNPISSLLISIHLIQRQYPSDDHLQEYALRMKESANEILRLVDNVLEIAKLETGLSIQLVSVDLHPFLRHICLLFYTQAESKGIAFFTDFDGIPSDYHAYFNADQMTSVLSNLLANAIKYTASGGVVRFTVTANETELLFKIADTGYGISESELPLIFQRFYRANLIKDAVEGSGLGLYIVKSIVEQHQGRVWVESELGKGSTFYVSIPAHPVASHA